MGKALVILEGNKTLREILRGLTKMALHGVIIVKYLSPVTSKLSEVTPVK